MSPFGEPQAEHTCGPCKKLKRKCDRQLPECGLCCRTGRVCDYTPPTPLASSREDYAALQTRLSALESLIAGSSRSQQRLPEGPSSSTSTSVFQAYNATIRHKTAKLPPALFLDIDCFKWAGMRLPQPLVDIPPEVLGVLIQQSTVVDISQEYFDTVHPWLPIISRKRIELGLTFQHGGPDLAMLFLAMKLLITPPTSGDRQSLYPMSKDFLVKFEVAGLVSQVCLQAMVLVAVYEYGHEIYPSAWMTVGACARYAELLDLSCWAESTVLLPCSTWTEVEERRRLWWAVFILDRVVCMGSRRQYTLPEPTGEAKLPVANHIWDQGLVMEAIAQPADTAEASDDPFIQLCQVALLVGKAIHLARLGGERHAHLTEASTLLDQLCGFGAQQRLHDRVDELPYSGAHCLLRSAVFLVLDLLSCPEKLGPQPGYRLAAGAMESQGREMQERAVACMRDVSEQSRVFAVRLLTSSDSQPAQYREVVRVSPFILDSLYCTVSTYCWLAGESGIAMYREQLNQLDDCLAKLALRWILADKYRTLGRFHDVVGRTSTVTGSG